MRTHNLTIRFRYALHHSRMMQIAILFGFWLAGEAFVRLVSLPLPGGIVGMALVLALLLSGRISLFSMKRGAEWFLAEMLLFFVPAVLAVLEHQELLGMLGLKIMAVILVGTLTVMTVTALTVDMCYRLSVRYAAK
ncbi:CidA/LrgA family protein [Brucella gallinifaecis]|uniref:CidA/LrgA family protein n=1 Tax=Brucella gallinifaecis TaxID=215590 RepID=A0A502BSI1_9HYPH|nr:CidA/LrgA family protein [Brucella gallinifaecis]TPF76246.1 CidA/LrgA family protein [Brucella gallinifaecis]